MTKEQIETYRQLHDQIEDRLVDIRSIFGLSLHSRIESFLFDGSDFEILVREYGPNGEKNCERLSIETFLTDLDTLRERAEAAEAEKERKESERKAYLAKEAEAKELKEYNRLKAKFESA